MTQHPEDPFAEPTESALRAQELPGQPHPMFAVRLAVEAQPTIVLTVLVDELV